MFDWINFININIENCILDVRISDNVLDEENWPIHRLTIKDGIVIDQVEIQSGCYSMSHMVGWTIDQVSSWTCYNSTGSYPENYYELRFIEMIIIPNDINVIHWDMQYPISEIL